MSKIERCIVLRGTCLMCGLDEQATVFCVKCVGWPKPVKEIGRLMTHRDPTFYRQMKHIKTRDPSWANNNDPLWDNIIRLIEDG